MGWISTEASDPAGQEEKRHETFIWFEGQSAPGGEVLTAVVLACMIVSPVSAEEVMVREGKTAQFSFTASYNAPQGRASYGPSKLRLSYKTLDGTATAGQDYDQANWWSDHVIGLSNSALTIEVETFEDDVQEDDETFSIQIVKMEVWIASDFWSAGGQWQQVPLPGNWTLEGATKAVIQDAIE